MEIHESVTSSPWLFAEKIGDIRHGHASIPSYFVAQGYAPQNIHGGLVI